MEKFSKLKPKNDFNEPDDDIKYEDGKLKIVNDTD